MKLSKNEQMAIKRKNAEHVYMPIIKKWGSFKSDMEYILKNKDKVSEEDYKLFKYFNNWYKDKEVMVNEIVADYLMAAKIRTLMDYAKRTREGIMPKHFDEEAENE